MNQRRVFLIIGGAAATLLLITAAEKLPLFSLLLSLLAPFPAAYVHMAGGLFPGAGVIALCATVLTALGGLGEAGSYLFQFGIGSFILPFLLKKKWPWDRAVAMTLAIVVLTSFLTLTGYALYNNENVGHLVGSYVQEQLEQARQLALETDFSSEQREELNFVLEKAGGFIQKAYPALALVTNGGALLFVLLLLNRIPAMAREIQGAAFRSWSVSPWLIWILIAGGFGLFLGTGPVEVVALNILVFLLPVYFLQGLAIVAFYFWKKKFSPWLRAIGYALVVTINPLPVLVAGIGVFDLWINFRKPRIKKEN